MQTPRNENIPEGKVFIIEKDVPCVNQRNMYSTLKKALEKMSFGESLLVDMRYIPELSGLPASLAAGKLVACLKHFSLTHGFRVSTHREVNKVRIWKLECSGSDKV